MKRWMKRRAAIEPIIGHLKADHRMNRNHYRGEQGDAANALLSAAGFNLRKLLAFFLCLFSRQMFALQRATARHHFTAPAHAVP